MYNSISFSRDQLIFLGNVLKRNAPPIDPEDDSVAYTRQAYRDAADFIQSLADPENMRRATQPGRLSE